MPLLSSIPQKTVTGAFATLLLLSSSSFSFAIDASEVVERFAAFYAKQGQVITYSSIEDDNGDSFNLKGAVLTFADGKPVGVKNIQFNSVTENSDGDVIVGSVVYEQINASKNEATINIREAAVNDLVLPAKDNTNAVKRMVYFSSLSVKNINVMIDGKSTVDVGAINVNYGDIVEGQPIAMSGGASGISADLTGVGDAKFREGLKKLGYGTSFTGNMALGGSWNPVDGRMEISKYDIKIDNVGTLSMLFTLNGYTADLAQRIQKASADAQASGNQQAAGMAMMAELPKLFFESAKFSFTDDSITRRVLKMQAATMGGTADDVAKMVPVMMPMVLGGLGNPEFSAMVAGAVGRFVGEPKNITIAAKPAKPLAFSELMGMGMAAPQSLIGALAVKVTANE